MKKRFLGIVLSVLIALSSFGGFSYADDKGILSDDSAKNVRFVDGTAFNGSGLTADSPYNTFAQAAADLNQTGGTIVVTGETTDFALANTGDIVVTSVYGGVNYKEAGAALNFGSAHNKLKLSYSNTPGKFTLENIKIICPNSDGWHLMGHETEIKDTVEVYNPSGAVNSSVQIMSLISTGGNYAGNAMPDVHNGIIKVTVGNTNNASVILGPCEDITIGGADITVNGVLPVINVSNNTWANYDHGQLKVAGDVKVKVNGTLKDITARSTETNDFSLEQFDGDLSVIVANGGKFTGVISNHVKMRANNWFIINEAENATLAHGENGKDIILTMKGNLDFNTAVVTNTDTSKSYTYDIVNGVSRFSLNESGKYTVALAKTEKKSVSFIDAVCDNTVSKIDAITGTTITLPVLSDTGNYIFKGWTDVESGETAKYTDSYTVTNDITLYAVWVEIEYEADVRFVNGSASENGTGMSPASPYKDFAKAAADLNATGGTIVVTGETQNFSLANTGDIVITSLYNGVDYRESGAKLNFGSNSNKIIVGIVPNPGKVTFDNLTIIQPASDGWHLMGHDLEITDTVKALTSSGSSASIQIMAVCSSNATPPSVVPAEMNLTINNTTIGAIILGSRKEQIISGANIVIDGKLGSIAVSNNTYEKYDWLNTSPGFGQLTVNGDVKITVNGTLSDNIYARKHVLTADSFDYGLKKINGNIAVIVNHGGTYSRNIDTIVQSRTEGKWIKITGIQGTTLAYGDNADDIVLTLDNGLDYNFAVLKNKTTSKTYSYYIDGNISEFTIPESGEYTIELTKKEPVTISLVDTNNTTDFEDIITYIGDSITLPTLEGTDITIFKGWSTTEGSTEAEYESGDEYTVSGNATLYTVWGESETYTVKFMNGDKEFSKFVGVEGKEIKYPSTYPSKQGYYFTGWDKNPTVIETKDITINATFKTASELGYHVYYWNGSSSVDGDGTYEKPFQLMASLVKKLNETGGVVVCLGKCNILYQPRLINTKDVTFTSLDPLTGVDFGGEFDSSLNYTGGHLYMPQGVYFGGSTELTGAIIFENIDILNFNGQYGIGHMTFDGHEYVFGENVRHLAPESGKEIEWFLGGTSTNNAAKPHMVKGVFKSPLLGRNFVARGGGVFDIDHVEYDSYAKSVVNLAADSADIVTITGPVLLTYYAGSSGSTIYHSRTSYAFGAKSYASIILNDGVTVENKLNTSETGIDGRVYIINSPTGGTVTNGATRGTYHIESDQYNYAKILNFANEVVAEGIIIDGADMSIPDYGTYSVVYSNKDIYGIEYVTSPYDEICPESYIVNSEETDKLKITLPVLAKQNAHTFAGWTTVKNGDTVEYNGGAEYTLSGMVTLYAVWTDIPTFTVTFKDDDGNILHKATGYQGAPLTFPENNPYRYEEKLLGYAYEGTIDVLSKESLIPGENKVALPVWGEIPVGETRLYVNSLTGNDTNKGTTPDKALATIAKAVTTLANSGGYIIVTGGKCELHTYWNNAADITLTSLDPASKIDYRPAGINDDKLSFKEGAVITYKFAPFGRNTITGKITIDHVTLLNNQNNQFFCFEGHPFEFGKGISVYQQTSDSAEITVSNVQARALGESNAVATNPEGIVMTLNGFENGTPNIYTVGKATNTIPGMEITVDSYYDGAIRMGNDSGGGLTTIDGDIKLTFNASVKNSMNFTDAKYTNPVKGNVYAVYNNNATANISAIKFDEGYGTYSIHAGNNIVLSHGENGTFKADPIDGIGSEFIKLTDENGDIAQYIKTVDGKADITLDKFGDYTVQYSDIAMYNLKYETGDDELDIDGSWYEEGYEIDLIFNLDRYGYIFGGWTDGNKTYTEGLFTMPQKNVTLTAVWTEAPKFTVTFDANGSDIVVPKPISEYDGETIILDKVSSENTVFVGWNTDKNAKTGLLSHVVTSDTTLYAIHTTEPVYIVDSYYRGDPNNYTGSRNSFRRYVIDVYLDNAVASEGAFKLNTDNKFLYYLGHVPQEGINATVNANVVSGSSGTPGLQYYTTPSVEFKWRSDAPVDATSGRIRIARIMMYFSSWGMGYDQIEKRTSDEVVSAFEGYKATAGDSEAYVSANFYKGVKTDEVKISGKVTIEGRETGTSAKYDFLKLYILDEAGDAVDFKVLENAESTKRTFSYTTEIIPGNYTFRIMKNGYITRNVPISITESCNIPELVIFAGDTLDQFGRGDGVIDIDDFTRILRGFSRDFALDKYIDAIDINEDGTVNVSDLAIIKNNFTSNVTPSEISTFIDKDNLKLTDWKIVVNDSAIEITGGSEEAAASGLDYLEEHGSNGTYNIPVTISHTTDYDISTIFNNNVSISEYKIVINENDKIAAEYAQYIYDYIAELSGFGLPIVSDTEAAYDYEILVGSTSRRNNPITAVEEYNVYEEDGKFYVFYGDEQSAEMACLDLCEKILGKDSEGYDDDGHVNVVAGASYSGKWSVLSRFGVMSDSHIGERYNWANYDWLYNTFENFETAHASKPLDFIVSLGDNIDDGYANTYAADYKVYLEEIKQLDICDPVNPIDGRAVGKIPHYELCGNHDPIANQFDASGNLKIRFFKNKLWYTENENGEKVAHIGFFTNYGGYPLHDYAYSGTYASYFSYGRVDDQMVKFVEESIIAANAEGAKHIILYNHFGMSQQVGSPCLPETGLGKIADVCEKYGIKLYFNGHEHDVPYSLRRYNEIYDYDVSMTAHKHAIVEITTLRAKVTIYNSADNSLFRTDIVPLSGRGTAKQTFAK